MGRKLPNLYNSRRKPGDWNIKLPNNTIIPPEYPAFFFTLDLHNPNLPQPPTQLGLTSHLGIHLNELRHSYRIARLKAAIGLYGLESFREELR
jgi:hypothetical protein